MRMALVMTIGGRTVTIIKCDVKNCVNKDAEFCQANKISIKDGECKTACTFEELMKQRPNLSDKYKV